LQDVKAIQRTLATGFAVRRIAELPSYDQNADVPVQLAIDHGVWKVVQWVNSATITGGCADVWELH
jgi:hypothetical protein